MPTGIEVAGLVLGIVGAYPAILSVLDIYTTALESRSVYLEQKIQALKLSLNVQAVLFENSCAILLGERDISDLRSDNPDWKRIQDTLKSRFTDQVQWETFCGLLKSLHRTWEDPEAQEQEMSFLERAETILSRLKFTASNTERCFLLNKLKEENQALRLLTKTCQQTIRDQHHQTQANVTTFIFKEFRTTAVGFCKTVAESLNCGCHASHRANLKLEAFPNVLGASDTSSIPPLDLTVESKQPTGIITCHANWRVLALEKSSASIPVVEIRDLCLALRSDSSSGYLSQDNSYVLRRPQGTEGSYHIEILPSPTLPPGRFKSLKDVISSDTSYTCFPYYFFERDKLYLAVVLTCCVLGLHTSPWLPDDWSSNDILFESDRGDTVHAALKKPHLTAILSSRMVEESPALFPIVGIRNRSLYALGMVVLEILMGKPLNSKKVEGERDEYETAWRIEQEICGRELPLWKTVVGRCLHCPFEEDELDLAKEPFAQRIQTDILFPLVDALRRLGGPIRS
ncbi:hypothetical protein AOQ84DRAFT_375136 [Glonium stellatum]|uniref:DUF7580 domain-containing protein n=1 Tax=Glonium stellatum TaxID=574774 RepID=A0A8E2F428_9PEZI|nr:hypothetical protein AOQ84DRAFT_375136 [Glonium stellatum]